jgi:hypothetical protein
MRLRNARRMVSGFAKPQLDATRCKGLSVSVLHKYLIRDHLGCGKPLCQFRGVLPVSRHVESVEQSSAAQEEGAGAD